jgi:hypothetical protein
VKQFVEYLKRLYPKGLSNNMAVYRKINDEKLKMNSVYGKKFSSNVFSRDNVTVASQGKGKFFQHGSYYTIHSEQIFLNGTRITGEYEPVLAAIYASDRSDARLSTTRIGIMPIGGLRGAVLI